MNSLCASKLAGWRWFAPEQYEEEYERDIFSKRVEGKDVYDRRLSGVQQNGNCAE